MGGGTTEPMSSPSDTIYALATPPGKSGVAVVRVSGPASWESLKILTGKNLEENAPLSPQLELCKIIDPVSRETIDENEDNYKLSDLWFQWI